MSRRPEQLLGRLGRLPFPLRAPTWPATVARAAPERRVGLDYDHEWSRRYPVRLARAIVLDTVTRPVTRALAPPTIVGIEHLRHVEDPVIFAANHASHLDTALLLTALPTRFRHHSIVAAASDYFFNRTWKAILWSFSLAAIPIDRSRVNRRSADTAAELLGDGWNLVIFPEGGRSPDGWAQSFKGGAAYMACRTGRPVVPVYLHGTRHVAPKRPDAGTRAPGGSGTEGRARPVVRRSPVTIVFGAPLHPEDGEAARHFGVRVERAVAVLADEVHSDWWQARTRAAAGTTPPASGPVASPWRRAWALGASPGDERPAPGERVWPKV